MRTDEAAAPARTLHTPERCAALVETLNSCRDETDAYTRSALCETFLPETWWSRTGIGLRALPLPLLCALCAYDPVSQETIRALLEEGIGALPSPGRPFASYRLVGGEQDTEAVLYAPIYLFARLLRQMFYAERSPVFLTVRDHAVSLLRQTWDTYVHEDLKFRAVRYHGEWDFGISAVAQIRPWSLREGRAPNPWYRERIARSSLQEYRNPYAPWAQLEHAYGLRVRPIEIETPRDRLRLHLALSHVPDALKPLDVVLRTRKEP